MSVSGIVLLPASRLVQPSDPPEQSLLPLTDISRIFMIGLFQENGTAREADIGLCRGYQKSFLLENGAEREANIALRRGCQVHHHATLVASPQVGRSGHLGCVLCHHTNLLTACLCHTQATPV